LTALLFAVSVVCGDCAPLVDTDGDGLSDDLEVFIGTDPNKADTDGDFLNDGYEITTIHTNPLLSDTDADGLLDGIETLITKTDPLDFDSDDDGLNDGSEKNTHSTNPLNPDTDSDGMRDGWEVQYGLNPLVNDSALDADSDGLTNLQEYTLKTNPKNIDTDGDGLPDKWEVQYGLNPLVNDSALDVDSDGLINLREFQFGANPKDSDSDDDGIADGAEIDIYVTQLLNPDTDADGLTDYQELFVFDTDPRVSTAMPTVPIFRPVGNPRNPDDDGGQSDIQNTGRGYVGQEFDMSVTEVTNWMYALFLNSVAKRDRLHGLYKTDMGDNAEGGIIRRGSLGSYTYEVKPGFEDKPVNFVSLWDSLRYINWLHNWKVRDSQMRDAFRPTLSGSEDQNAATTEDGVYALRGTNPDNFTRHPAAQFFLPDVDEWHKAAYYDPDPGGNRPSESYWDRATQTMGSALGSSALPLVPVGTGSGNYFGPSHYKTYDQDGNVAEWTQDALILGGRATGTASNTTEIASLGFRVARPVADAPETQAVLPLMVEVGEPGNLADEEFAPELGDPKLGAVNYIFQMGAYEVTNREYAKFLNDKAKEDSFYRLYDTRMGSDAASGGILRTGVNGAYIYTIKRGFAKKPVVYVSIFSAMRYCNWLHNGGRADSDMEAGAYRLLGNVPTNTDKLTRNATARYYLPNTNEFYKAAYYDSSSVATATFDYWKFATRSDSFNATSNDSNLANVDFSSLASYFGTYGQSGNVGYANPGSGANDPAPEPTAANSGELLEEPNNTDDESATRTFRVAAALGVETLRPLADQDGDGMPNGWELLNGLDPFVNDAALDADSDGLTNLQEFMAGTDPSYADTDGDGMPDKWEVNNAFNPSSASDAEVDADSDGLTNLREFQLGTDPRKADTDGDGMPDKWEVDNAFNPSNAADAAQDADADSLTNLREFRLGTNPRNRDTDGDGLADGAEVDTYRTDPKNTDTDGDSLSDSVEIAGGTDPLTFNTPAAAPAMVAVTSPGNTGDPANSGYGAVAYAYRIGTYEVTNEDYAKFLNAVATVSDSRNLYDARMAYTGQQDTSDPRNITIKGGIDRSGSAGAYTYAVKSGYAQKPVNFVSYNSALRYCNWLHNGGVAGADTESGAYNMAGAQTRVAAARFWLPNQNEWYKAAAYDAAAGGRYWLYAIRADSATASQVAVQSSGGLVNVASPGMASAYGTYGQSGNAAEWMEKAPGGNPTALGGSILSYVYSDSGGNVTTRSLYEPTTGSSGRFDLGFRIASVAAVSVALPATFATRYPGISTTDKIDGSPALLDYFLGGTISIPPDHANHPSLSIVDGKLRYSFTARTDDPSLVYRVETSTTLAPGSWSTGSLTVSSPQMLSSTLTRRTFEVSASGDRQRFFKLIVEQH